MLKGAFVGLLCGVCDHHRESHSTATECQSHIVSERDTFDVELFVPDQRGPIL